MLLELLRFLSFKKNGIIKLKSVLHLSRFFQMVLLNKVGKDFWVWKLLRFHQVWVVHNQVILFHNGIDCVILHVYQTEAMLLTIDDQLLEASLLVFNVR